MTHATARLDRRAFVRGTLAATAVFLTARNVIPAAAVVPPDDFARVTVAEFGRLLRHGSSP